MGLVISTALKSQIRHWWQGTALNMASGRSQAIARKIEKPASTRDFLLSFIALFLQSQPAQLFLRRNRAAHHNQAVRMRALAHSARDDPIKRITCSVIASHVRAIASILN